jgi:hypothetical protein
MPWSFARSLWCAPVLAVLLAPSAAAQLVVVSSDPAINASNVAPNKSIVVDFDRALDPSTIGNFRVYGNAGGTVPGAIVLENGNQRLRFSPARSYFAGELITVNMSHDLRAQDGTFLRQAGWVVSFRAKAEAAPMTFTTVMSFFTEPGQFTRIYGGQMCDLDGDDYLDMSIISEIADDVRVFKNKADATGMYIHPPFSVTGVDTQPSPNENADLDGDGNIDIVTCNAIGGSVSVLLGNGQGGFAPAVTYTMGLDPHGLALIDCDGDGDMDVVTANQGSDNLTLRRNNGDGTFGAVTSFEGGGTAEYSVQAADMNADGITDLVAGMRGSLRIVVHLGNGDGTFTPQANNNAGGAVWMLTCADIDADGKIDVSCANGGSANGSILYGNGDGTLQPAQTIGTGNHTNASDLADLDGDGDLDWVLSVFGGSQWRMYRNNAGTMSHVATFGSPANPACAALFDIDNDRDIDLVLLTETSDEIVVKENGALNASTLCFGTASACPCGNAGAKGHGCETSLQNGGSLLNASGAASVASDTLSLVASGLPPTAPTLFFQGTTQVAGGAGQAFGDGLRCAGGTVIRLGTRAAVNGFATYGGMNAGDVPISVQGAVPPGGATRIYQGWFRNAAPFCTSDTFNLTNGVLVLWGS